MQTYVEHASICVPDIDEAIRFFTTAMPDFRVRHDAGTGDKRWIHLGTDTTYMAINQRPDCAGVRFEERIPGYHHVGFVVSDADALRARMLAAGYQEGFVPDPHPHRKRVYFIDKNGMEYEFIQYYSDDFAKRNAYSL